MPKRYIPRYPWERGSPSLDTRGQLMSLAGILSFWGLQGEVGECQGQHALRKGNKVKKGKKKKKKRSTCNLSEKQEAKKNRVKKINYGKTLRKIPKKLPKHKSSSNQESGTQEASRSTISLLLVLSCFRWLNCLFRCLNCLYLVLGNSNLSCERLAWVYCNY